MLYAELLRGLAFGPVADLIDLSDPDHDAAVWNLEPIVDNQGEDGARHLLRQARSRADAHRFGVEAPSPPKSPPPAVDKIITAGTTRSRNEGDQPMEQPMTEHPAIAPQPEAIVTTDDFPTPEYPDTSTSSGAPL